MALPCQRVWLCRTRILSVERQVEARGPIVWAFLVAQDHVREHFDTDYELPVVVDQSHLSELIHEVCDSRASGPYHLCQGLMAQQRNSRMGQRIVLRRRASLIRNVRRDHTERSEYSKPAVQA